MFKSTSTILDLLSTLYHFAFHILAKIETTLNSTLMKWNPLCSTFLEIPHCLEDIGGGQTPGLTLVCRAGAEPAKDPHYNKINVTLQLKNAPCGILNSQCTFGRRCIKCFLRAGKVDLLLYKVKAQGIIFPSRFTLPYLRTAIIVSHCSQS